MAVLLGALLVAGCWPIGWTSVGPVGPAVTEPPSSSATPVPSDAWGTHEIVIIQLTPSGGAALTEEQHVAAERVVRDRLAALGVPGVSVRAIPDGRLRIDVADPEWADTVRRLATTPGELSFVAVPPGYSNDVRQGEPLPADMPVEVIVVPGQILEAAPGTNEFGMLAVDLQLDDVGAAAFDAWAADHVGQQLAMVLDGIVLSAPVSNAMRYGGQAQITGDLDAQAMEELAAILAGGILPVPAEVLWLCPADDPAPVCPSPMPSAD